MQLEYVLRRTWFTCLRVPNTNAENCWQDKQRYMYLRLRRLVGSFNKHLFHKLHYERKLVVQATVCIRCEYIKSSFSRFLFNENKHVGSFVSYNARLKIASVSHELKCVSRHHIRRYHREDRHRPPHIQDTANTVDNFSTMAI